MGRIVDLDFDRLEHDGFTVLKGLVRPEECANFEREIALVGGQLARQWNVERRYEEAIADVLVGAGCHRSMFFDHVKRLFSVARLSTDIATALEQAGLFRHAGIAVPIVWPTLRADLPNEGTYELALHQDFATTRCRTAWRMWIPFRAVDRYHGTMEVAPRSHNAGAYQYAQDQSGGLSIDRSELANRGLATQVLELPAGDGVIFNPWLVHGSVPNRSDRVKWVLLLHIQDLAAFVNPDEPADPVYSFLELSSRGRPSTPVPGNRQ